MGEYHHARLKAGQFAGGLVAGGLVDQSLILSALIEASDEISASHEDDAATVEKEQKALQDGFAEGLKKPITKLKTQQSLKKLMSHFLPVDITDLNDSDAEQYANLMAITKLDVYALKMAEILNKFDKNRFVFSFNERTYRGEVDSPDAVSIKELLDCTIRIVYSVEDFSESSPRMSHIMEIHSEREGHQEVELTANDLSSAQAFKLKFAHMRLLSQAKPDDLDLLQKALYYKAIPKVRKVNYLGYDEKSGYFVFNRFLYDIKGERHNLNAHGFF